MISAPELASIYEDLKGTLERYCRGLGADAQTAEDVVQDAMIRFWRRYHRGRKPLNLAVQICKRLMYNLGRDVRARRELLAREPLDQAPDAPDEALEREERCREVRRVMLMGLRGKPYMVVRLYLEGHAPRDISEQTGLPVGRVYHELRRAG